LQVSTVERKVEELEAKEQPQQQRNDKEDERIKGKLKEFKRRFKGKNIFVYKCKSCYRYDFINEKVCP